MHSLAVSTGPNDVHPEHARQIMRHRKSLPRMSSADMHTAWGLVDELACTYRAVDTVHAMRIAKVLVDSRNIGKAGLRTMQKLRPAMHAIRWTGKAQHPAPPVHGNPGMILALRRAGWLK